MPRIATVATATPSNIISQEEVKKFAKSLYGENKLFNRLLPVFDNAIVERRCLAVDLDWLSRKHSFTESNDLYIQVALDLSAQVSTDAAYQCGLSTEEFDIVFFISTTGLSTPSIDGRLFNRIALNPHIKRVPIWGLGCAGGAGALARAYDYLKSYPTHRALIIAVEFCSLSFQLNELSKTNVISSALFGDGAAACVVLGDRVPFKDTGREQPSILGSLSTIYPDSEDVMSWQATSDGFKVRLSRDIPSIVTSLVKGNIEELLQDLELKLNDLTHLILHPGGTKVLQAYADGIGTSIEKLAHSNSVLRDFGNMSSVTVYFVLKRFLENSRQHSRQHSGEYGLVGALGPGFSSELVLLQWN